jgi:DNA-binding NtrC family response regulator
MSDAKVLIVDDDPDHLTVYGIILQRAGFDPTPCLVTPRAVDLPQDGNVKLVILDYSLHTRMTPVEVAQKIGREYPDVPILLLSDVYGLPTDIAPFVKAFVRKCDPERLVSTVKRMMNGG